MMRALFLVTGFAACASAPLAHSADDGAPPQTQVKRVAQAPVLGRLFFSPEERAALDVARRSKPVAPTPEAEAPPPPPLPQIVTYGGIVRRSDGKAMLWINNQLVEEKEALTGLNLRGKVRPDGAVTLQVPDSRTTIEVKVGQSVEVHTGKVAETRKPRAERPVPGEAPPASDGAGAKPVSEPSAQAPTPAPGSAPRTEAPAAPPASPAAPPRSDAR